MRFFYRQHPERLWFEVTFQTLATLLWWKVDAPDSFGDYEFRMCPPSRLPDDRLAVVTFESGHMRILRGAS